MHRLPVPFIMLTVSRDSLLEVLRIFPLLWEENQVSSPTLPARWPCRTPSLTTSLWTYRFLITLAFSPCDSSRHVGSHSETFVPDISLVQNSLSLNSCMSEFSFHSDLASCHSPGETFSGFNLRESPSNLCHLTSFSSFFFLAHFCTLFF